MIDINDLAELTAIRLEGDELRLGAMVRHAELLSSAVVGEHFAIFHDAERVIADPVVRNRGTVGGSLCQADPSEDLSAAFTAVHAVAVIQGADGQRTVPVREFHSGPYQTVVGDAELLVEIRVPIRPGGGSAYVKVERRVGDWAVAAAGAAIWLDGDTVVRGRHRAHRRRRRALRRAGGRGVPARRDRRRRRASPRRGGSRPSTATPPPTSADRSTTSATWPAN